MLRRIAIALAVLGCHSAPVPANPPPPPKPTAPPIAKTPDELCAAGNADICDDFGDRLVMSEDNVPQDLPRARKLYQIDCEKLADARGCDSYGDMFLTGLGVPADVDRALALINRACDGRYARACERLGTLYIEGLIKHDYIADPRGAEYMRRACEAESAEACLYFGDFLLQGRGVGKDVPAAHRYFQRSCAMGDQRGCEADAEP
jgi:TPR repeat protein